VETALAAAPPSSTARRSQDRALTDRGGRAEAAATLAPQAFAGSFETFQVGPSNQKAVTLARMIAAKFSAATQLAVFYGEPGVGKTHLAEAICAAIVARDPAIRAVITSSLTFIDRFLSSMRNREEGPAFKADCRAPDVLVIDDVQHIAGKKATEEEFMALLSYHLERGHQVILTADVGPGELDGFSGRLKHRLRCATACEIAMPDLALRRAILDSRVVVHAQSHPGFTVAPEALDLIATRMDVSGRELDGAISQLVLEWEMLQSPITAARAETVLRSRLVGAEKRIMIDHVREAAAQHFKMTQQELLRRTRERAVSYPRQVAMYVACKLTQQSLPNIAKYMGNFDHTTVLHARKKIDKLLLKGENESVRRDVDAVIKMARQLP
jgi:chromosomal replication initiator protein